MAANAPSPKLTPASRPPDQTTGARRTAMGSSSPDGKSEKETVQAKKKVRPLNLDTKERSAPVVQTAAMDTETTETTQQEIPINEQKHNFSAWNNGTTGLFKGAHMDEGWYVAESDSEDVANQEREEDYELDEDGYDPRCPSVLFTAAQKNKWRREWRSALVVQGLGRKVPYIPLARRLNFLWARDGEIQISDMDNGCYLVRFRSQRDYEQALTGGPWLIGDTYLAVHRWYKGFNPWKAEVQNTLVWVQLPRLPIEFFNKEAVMQIGSLIGRPVRVDRATELGARAKFARVCVEVDLTQPLLGSYKVEGVKYLIGYEGLQYICGNCGKYGKPSNKCNCTNVSPMGEDEEVVEVPETQEEDPTRGQIYGS
ncbi:unnamed protein product [Linum tenue]|uniref:DUF4283 domain-containing protein n=1 Tax=Linum tenue TaxID=586396 RepID=A0AAV0MHK0_9ROSI|nr:unnamed protein product [Linum tenue]